MPGLRSLLVRRRSAMVPMVVDGFDNLHRSSLINQSHHWGFNQNRLTEEAEINPVAEGNVSVDVENDFCSVELQSQPIAVVSVVIDTRLADTSQLSLPHETTFCMERKPYEFSSRSKNYDFIHDSACGAFSARYQRPLNISGRPEHLECDDCNSSLNCKCENISNQLNLRRTYSGLNQVMSHFDTCSLKSKDNAAAIACRLINDFHSFGTLKKIETIKYCISVLSHELTVTNKTLCNLPFRNLESNACNPVHAAFFDTVSLLKLEIPVIETTILKKNEISFCVKDIHMPIPCLTEECVSVHTYPNSAFRIKKCKLTIQHVDAVGMQSSLTGINGRVNKQKGRALNVSSQLLVSRPKRKAAILATESCQLTLTMYERNGHLVICDQLPITEIYNVMERPQVNIAISQQKEIPTLPPCQVLLCDVFGGKLTGLSCPMCFNFYNSDSMTMQLLWNTMTLQCQFCNWNVVRKVWNREVDMDMK